MIITNKIPLRMCINDTHSSFSFFPISNNTQSRTNINIHNPTTNTILPTFGTITKDIDLVSIRIPWTFVVTKIYLHIVNKTTQRDFSLIKNLYHSSYFNLIQHNNSVNTSKFLPYKDRNFHLYTHLNLQHDNFSSLEKQLIHIQYDEFLLVPTSLWPHFQPLHSLHYDPTSSCTSFGGSTDCYFQLSSYSSQ